MISGATSLLTPGKIKGKWVYDMPRSARTVAFRLKVRDFSRCLHVSSANFTVNYAHWFRGTPAFSNFQ